MKFTIPLALAFLSFGMSATAQSSSDCFDPACTGMMNIGLDCGIDFSSLSYTSNLEQEQCVCNSKDARSIIQTCLDCLEVSDSLPNDLDSYSEMCAGRTGAGSKSCSRFGSAPYVIGGLVAGMGILGMA